MQRRALLSGAIKQRIAEDLGKAGRADPAYPLSELPPVIAALGLGADGRPLVIRKSVIEKAMGKHGLSLDETLAAVDALADPVMAFDSATVSGGLVALVDTGTDKAVVVAIHPDGEVGRIAVSVVASVHAKDSPRAIVNWINDGLTRYINGKSADAWFQSRRLQLPRE